IGALYRASQELASSVSAEPLRRFADPGGSARQKHRQPQSRNAPVREKFRRDSTTENSPPCPIRDPPSSSVLGKCMLRRFRLQTSWTSFLTALHPPCHSAYRARARARQCA